MTKNQLPLQYKIKSWRQLPKCLSNNSRDLRIHITDFFNNDLLTGFRISVDHFKMGTLFACVLEGKGSLITDVEPYSADELSTDAILAELRRYGFLITFAQELGLSGPQIEYLISLDKLGYDKIRVINVWYIKNHVHYQEPKVVAFQSNPLGDWLNNGYSPSFKEFTSALVDGTAINLSAISETNHYRWDWLKDSVESIQDIIDENASDNSDPEIVDTDDSQEGGE